MLIIFSMLILGLFTLLLVSAISSERINGVIINRAAALILLYSFILSASTLDVSTIGTGIGVFGGLYQITVVSKIVEGFIYLIGAMILSNTMLILKTSNIKINEMESRSYNNQIELSLKSEYPIVALFTVVGGILLIASNDLISMYLSIELQSFGLYVLATIYRDSQSATSAGLKYFLLGGLSSGFILLGSTIIYASLGVTNLESIYLLMSLEGNLDLPIFENSNKFISSTPVEIGLLVLITGFLFKIAAAPLHNWSPDVYDGVPTKVTSWLAIMAKISILTFLLDLGIGSISLTSPSLSSVSNLMLIAALLSLLIGTIVGLAQTRIKRLLAYSTISHVGFLLLAIAINTEDSIESFIFYLIQYSLTSANAFFILIAFGSLSLTLSGESKEKKNITTESTEAEYSPVQFIAQLKGQFSLNNSASVLLALSLSIVLFSMAGIPPLVGFFAKQAVLLAAVKNGFIFLSLVAIITSVISAAYYLRIIKRMLFDIRSEEDNNTELHIMPLNPLSLLPLSTEGGKRIKEKGDETSNKEVINNKSFADKVNHQLEDKSPNLTFLYNSYKGEMSNSLSFSISILTILTIVFVFKPLLILNSAHIMALSLFYL